MKRKKKYLRIEGIKSIEGTPSKYSLEGVGAPPTTTRVKDDL
jgi:hypothetical protein